MGHKQYDQLKTLLALEAKQRLREEVLDDLLNAGEEIALSTYEPMIDAGEFNPHVFIVKEGLVRGTYLDKNMEKTVGFALPGTIIISFHSYYGDEPSYYRYEACCPTVVVRISRQHFDSMLQKSHEFALWVMSAHQNQLYYNEFQKHLLSGDAKSRLIQLTCRLQGIIADTQADGPSHTYSTDHTDSHDCNVKKEMHQRWRKIFQLVPSKIIASYLGITEQHLSKIKKELLKDTTVF